MKNNLELKVKEAQLDLLDELHRICVEHKLKYWLTGGSLIGAVRHDGFIPWDDDIDIGMMREDYEKLKLILDSELDSQFEFIDWYFDKNYPQPFGKLKIKNTHYREEISRDSLMNDGIFIDIFPYDNVPSSKRKRILQKYAIIIYRKILLLQSKFDLTNGNILKKALYLPLIFLSKIISRKRIIKNFDRVMTKFNDVSCLFVTNHGGSYSYEKEMLEVSWIKELFLHKFENNNFYIPEKYDDFLKHVYGDYMKLPPVEKRVGRHGVSYIDFGNYIVKNKIKEEKTNE